MDLNIVDVFQSRALVILKDSVIGGGLSNQGPAPSNRQPWAQEPSGRSGKDGPLILPQAAAFHLASLRSAMCRCLIQRRSSHGQRMFVNPARSRKGQAPFPVRSERRRFPSVRVVSCCAMVHTDTDSKP